MNIQREIVPHISDHWEKPTFVIKSGNTNGIIISKVIKKQKYATQEWEKQIISIKRISKSGEYRKNEVDIINKIKHDNIIECYGCGEDKDNYYIYMEWLDHSLRDLLNNEKNKKFLVNTIIWVTYELLLSINYIHENNLIHRDIKPENIMIDFKKHKVKLVDFGYSKEFQNESKNYTNCGTNRYSAPEVLKQNNQAGRKSDIWSLACTIIVMGGSVLPKIEDDKIDNNTQYLQCIPAYFPDYLKSMVKKCLHYNNDERCDIKWLLQNETFKLLSGFQFFIKNFSKFRVLKFENNQLFEIDSSKQDRVQKRSSDLDTNSVTHFTLYFSQPFNPGEIPDSVTHLTFGVGFNQLLNPGDIPNSVTHLTFGFDFNQPLKSGDIPNSVTHLTFGYCFNQLLKPYDIPNSVTHLTFGRLFNKPLKPGDIPNSVTHLTFGYCFDQPLKPGDIPNSVIHLTFGYDFNQPLNPGVIPNSVTHLTFGYNFNQRFEMDIQIDDFDLDFQLIQCCLIPYITTLALDSCYPYINQLTTNIPKLNHLIIKSYNGQNLEEFKNIKLELILYPSFKPSPHFLSKLPTTLKLLIDGYKYLYIDEYQNYFKINK